MLLSSLCPVQSFPYSLCMCLPLLSYSVFCLSFLSPCISISSPRPRLKGPSLRCLSLVLFWTCPAKLQLQSTQPSAFSDLDLDYWALLVQTPQSQRDRSSTFGTLAVHGIAQGFYALFQNKALPSKIKSAFLGSEIGNMYFLNFLRCFYDEGGVENLILHICSRQSLLDPQLHFPFSLPEPLWAVDLDFLPSLSPF